MSLCSVGSGTVYDKELSNAIIRSIDGAFTLCEFVLYQSDKLKGIWSRGGLNREGISEETSGSLKIQMLLYAVL